MPLLGRGYGDVRHVLRGGGAYSAVYTCNEWTGRALRARRGADGPVDAAVAEHHVAAAIEADGHFSDSRSSVRCRWNDVPGPTLR